MRKSRLFSPGFQSVSKLTGSVRGQIFKMLAFGVVGVLSGTMAFAQLAGGTYTINSGSPTGAGNYNDFSAFVTALAANGNAIAGNVTLNVVANSGPYTDQIVLPSISGTGPGPGSTRIGIVFNGNGEKITYNGGSTENATITLNGADYITFNDLVVERGTSGSYRWAVRLYNQANNVRFDGCTFDVGTYSTSYQIGMVLSSSNTSYSGAGLNAQFLEVWNSDFVGGYGGFWSYGPSTTTGTWSQGIDLSNNTFTACYYYPLRMYYGHYDVNIEGNYFTKGNQSYAFGYCMYIYRANNVTITKNHNVGYPYGLYCYYINQYNTGLVSGRSLIANNMIAPNLGPATTSATKYGLYCGYVQQTDFVYNSVNFEGTGTSSAYGLRVYYCTDAKVENNVVKSQSSSTNYMLYMYNPTGTYTCDYNTYFTESTNETYLLGTTTYQGLAALQSGTTTNANSQDLDPAFISSTDLHVNGANLFQKGNAVSSVSDDFDGTARPTVPSHGVHEFTPPNNDAGVLVFNQPVAVCPDTNGIIVTVKNYGALPLNSFMLHWTFSGNGSPVTADSQLITAAVALNPGSDTTLNVIGNVVMTSGAPGYNFLAWTTKPNNVQDEQTANDSMLYSTQTAMEGTFTIGGGTPDYATFSAAVFALNTYGVCSAVTFNVRQGTYNEQVNLGNLVGVSDVNTVTFQEDPANTAPVQIEYTASGNYDATVYLNGASWITFDGMVIDQLSTSNGTTVTLANMASHNTFSNCIMNGPSSSSTSTYMANIYASGENLDYNTFDNNEINNGSIGIYYYTSPQSIGAVFTGNEISNMYYRGVYLYYLQSLVFNDNVVDATSAYTSSYGMYFYSNQANDVEIRRNHVRGNYYGAYMYMGGNQNSSPQVTNNKFHAGDTTNLTANAYSAAYFYAGYGLFAHNTVISESKATSTYYNMYFNGGLNKSYNNLFVRSGTGNCIYVPSPFSLIESDYNAYSLSDGAISGLSYMQNLGFGDHSIQIAQQIFSNTDSLLTCTDSLVGAAIFLSEVPQDINFNDRNTQGPTIGPDEYTTSDAFSLGDDFTICDGDTVEIGQDVSGGSYLWSTTETTGTILVSTPGTYSVALNSNCGNADDEIVIGDGASVSVFSSQENYLTGIFTNMSMNADTYSWDFGDGASSTDENPSHLYAAGGTYNVCLTVSGICGDNTGCDSIKVATHIGINETNADNAVAIYPNPATSRLTVAVDGMSGDMLSIEISNLTGQVVMSKQTSDFNGYSTEKLDISKLTIGVYFVKIYTNEMATTKRLVVQK